MQHSNSTQGHIYDDEEDRRNRFLAPSNGNAGSFRERATSQPPSSPSQSFHSPSLQHHVPSSLGGGGGHAWSTQRMSASGLNSGARGAQSIPTRSSSYTAQGQFPSAMRDSLGSTYEYDESEAFSDIYDELYVQPALSTGRGRTYSPELTRSRSHSLATATGLGGSSYQGLHPSMASWNESSLSGPLNIPNSRYGEIKPPGSSRYGSLGTIGRSPINIHSSSPTGGSAVGNGYSSHRQVADISNISPFVRDVSQILVDEGSAFRELWAGMNPPRDENGGGGSGTTSRRHSVSVVQPRRGNVVGFNAPGNDGPEEQIRPSAFQPSAFGRGGLMLSDDDFASDLGMLSLNINDSGLGTSSSTLPTSQPSSLPIYAPHSRTPPTSDRVSPYRNINLSIPASTSYIARQALRSPSESGRSGGGGSPTQHLQDTSYHNGGQHLTARFIPGQGIQYLPQQSNLNGNAHVRQRTSSYSNPMTPGGRNPQFTPQQAFFPQQIQRRPSDASGASTLADLGKGVPLHSVPASWPLFIVEFKAGRTDLFYLTDLSIDIRVGDLVIVEADRGKDLGKVVNDSITLAEVEEFQKQQQARIGFGDQPMSPGGTPAGPQAKEINPKMIYGKAQAQDTQLLITKRQDEEKALQLCQSKVRQKKLPMEVVDAEYQWDRRKLTFFFVAEKRIDFRELVRELFRLYKTRIWMASLQGAGGFDQ